MATVHEFNVEAAMRLTKHAAASRILRIGTSNRMAETREAIIQSRALIARVDAIIAIDAARAGWLWPAYSIRS